MTAPKAPPPKAPMARLDRLLANLGYGSRREVSALVARGQVTLDGVVVKGGARINPFVQLRENRFSVINWTHRSHGFREVDGFPIPAFLTWRRNWRWCLMRFLQRSDGRHGASCC